MTLRRARKLATATAAMFAVAAALPIATAAPAQARTSGSVRVQVTNVNPPVAPPSKQPVPLTVTLVLTDTTSHPIDDVTITAERAFPIVSPDALDGELSNPVPPTDGTPVIPSKPVTANLQPGTPTTVTFTTTAGYDVAKTGFCACAKYGAYPLWFDAYDADSALLGQGETFVPSFYQSPTPVDVGWVWPLIDQPHRLLPNRPFVDDKLADSVRTGRLHRSLQVVQQVAGKVPLTLVIDPELLDELEVMATTKYQVHGPNGIVAGKGSAAAATWLHDLQQILTPPQSATPQGQSDASQNQVRVVLTPYGDPDVDSLTRAGLPWTSTLPPRMQQRVSAALGGYLPDSESAFPPSGTVAHDTLSALARSGITSVLLNSHAITRHTDDNGLPPSLASLRTAGTAAGSSVTAGLLNPTIQHLAAESMSEKGASEGSLLPQLLAEIAVQSATLSANDPQGSHAVFIAAPRRFNPLPGSAVHTILETSQSAFSRPVNVLDMLTGTPPPSGGSSITMPTAVPARLAPDQTSPTRLGKAIVDKATWVTRTLPSLRQMFTQHGTGNQQGQGSGPPNTTAGAQNLLDNISEAVQLSESSAWLPMSSIGGRAAGAQYAQSLARSVHSVLTGVHIGNPENANYTLASDNSPLLITVENDLPYTVWLRIRIGTVNRLPGFTARNVGVFSVAARSKDTEHIPTQVQRSGRIPIKAQLLTPDHPGRKLGKPVQLNVHSTVLGFIGVIITIVAGAVLVIALIFRFVRRWRHRGRPVDIRERPWRAGPVPASSPGTPEPASRANAPIAETVPPTEPGQ